MRRPMMPILLLVLLSLAPMMACSATSSRQTAGAPPRAARAPMPGEEVPAGQPAGRAADDRELERYAAREQRSAGLEKFEGGRIDTTSIIVILLLVIVLVLII